MRGLKKVRIVDNGSEFTADEIKAFEDFANPIMTAPKYIPTPVS